METRSLVNRRKDRLVHIAYFVALAFIYYLFVEYALAILAPFIFSFIIAMALQKPINFLSGKMNGKGKKALSFIFVSLIILTLVGIVILIGYLLTTEITKFAYTMKDKIKMIPGIVYDLKDKVENLILRLPPKAQNAVYNTLQGLMAKFTGIVQDADASAEAAAAASASGANTSSTLVSIIKVPLSGLWETAKGIPAFLTAVIISMISCFFLTADYDAFVGMIKNALSETGAENLTKAKHVLVDVFGKWLKSYAMILFITFCEMALGLTILNLTKIYVTEYIFVIALCIAIVDIFPVFGTGTILIPWSVYMLCTHHTKEGIGLLIIYATITFVRQIIEPKLVSSNVGLHPVLTIMAMYIGIQLFGAIGILLLPLTLIFVVTLNDEGIIHLWRSRNSDDEADKKDDNSEDDSEEKPDEEQSEAPAQVSETAAE